VNCSIKTKSLIFFVISFFISNYTLAAFQEGTPPAGADGGVGAVAASNSKYVAVGIFSKVMHSDDGVTWVKQSAPANGMSTFQNLLDITYGNGKFVAISSQSNIFTSSDGENWTEHTKPIPKASNAFTEPAFNSVVYNGTKFYVAGSSFKSDFSGSITSIAESADGTTWTEISTIEGVADTAMAWDGNQLIIAGTGGKIWTSADGVSWTGNDAPHAVNDFIDGIASNGTDKSVAIGWHLTVMHSVDGQTWTKIDYRDFNKEWQMGQTDVIWTGSQFVMVNNAGIISTSADGVSWTDDETFKDVLAFEDVASIGDQIVAVGSKVKQGGGKLPAFAYSGSLVATSNSVPSANAGTDQAVTAGETVSLSGTSSDSDGAISTYLWEQVSGTSVTLAATDANDTSFTAPSVSASEDLVFKFTVTDDAAATGSDEITVTVNPVNSAAPANSSTSGDTSNSGTSSSDSSDDSTSSSAMNPILLLSILLTVLYIRQKKQP